MKLPIAEQLIKPCNETCSFCFLNYADLISNNYLFNGIKPAQVSQIIQDTHHRVKTWQKDEIIHHHGDILDGLSIMVKGRVICEIMGFEGKVLRVEELKAPDAIACAFLYGQNTKIPFDVIAQENVKAIIIPKDSLLKLFMSNQQLLSNYLNLLTNRAQNQSKKLKLLGLSTLKGKVAYYLLECSKENNCGSYKMEKTQNDLAELFGVARPSIGRILKELDAHSIIQAKGKQITILDKTALEQLLK